MLRCMLFFFVFGIYCIFAAASFVLRGGRKNLLISDHSVDYVFSVPLGLLGSLIQFERRVSLVLWCTDSVAI